MLNLKKNRNTDPENPKPKKGKKAKAAKARYTIVDFPENATQEEKDAFWQQVRADQEALGKTYQFAEEHHDTNDAKKARTRRQALRITGGVIAGYFVFRACAPRRNTIDPNDYRNSDEITARAYAEIYSKDFYTWNQDDTEERGARLAKYNPSFDGKAGWNGTGWQTVVQATSIMCEKESDTQYTVTVANTLEGNPQPLYAAVSIFIKDGEPTIYSYPNLTNAPELPVPDAPDNSSLSRIGDATLTKTIQERLELFFAAWSEGNLTALDTLTTANYSLPPVLSGQTFEKVEELNLFTTAEQGNSTDPVTDVFAYALVSWKHNEASVSSYYRVDFKIDNTRWFIDAVDMAPPYTPAFVSSGNSQPSPTPTT